MEVSTTLTPKPNEFVIGQNSAYATTDIKKWKVIEYLLTKLEPVNLEDLGPDDEQCTICQQDFHVSEDVKLSHAPVKTVCGHIFGKPCLIKWLNPLCYRSLDEDRHGAALMGRHWYGDAKTDCPMCRRVFFPKCRVEPLEHLAQRLSFWDMAYDSAGVARSEKEERSRKHLWEYVEYCHSISQQPPETDGRLGYDLAQVHFNGFAAGLRNQPLTPTQRRLQAKLKGIALKDMKLSTFGSHGLVITLTRVDDKHRVTSSRSWALSLDSWICKN